jgi:hypothetical protein
MTSIALLKDRLTSFGVAARKPTDRIALARQHDDGRRHLAHILLGRSADHHQAIDARFRRLLLARATSDPAHARAPRLPSNWLNVSVPATRLSRRGAA